MGKFHRALGLAAALGACLCLAVPSAGALEYVYEGDEPGQSFYQPTTAQDDYVADSGDITVGADGTVGAGVDGNLSSGPLSGIELPVGEYPESWGTAVDMEIAANSVFVNELGPTSATTRIYTPVYLPTDIDSGALPTGEEVLTGGYYDKAPVTAGVPGSAFGLAVSAEGMPRLTKGGAIAQLKIPSIGLSKYVYDGTTQSNMNRGLAHFQCTPAWGGNICIAGHNRPVSTAGFGHLKEVKIGDTVLYTTVYGTATYVVTDIDTCATTDTSGLLQDGGNRITMYTCKAGQPQVKLKVTAVLAY